MYEVSFIYSNLSQHCFTFPYFQRHFFLSQDNGLLFLLPLPTVVFSVTLIDFLITHKCDHSFVSLLPSSIQYQAFLFHHLESGKVVAVCEEAFPNENVKRTTICHRSLVPRGRRARGGVPQIPRYICPTPKPPQIRGF